MEILKYLIRSAGSKEEALEAHLQRSASAARVYSSALQQFIEYAYAIGTTKDQIDLTADRLQSAYKQLRNVECEDVVVKRKLLGIIPLPDQRVY